MPKPRQRVAERMHAAVGIGAILGVRHEIHAGGAERHEARTGSDGARAHRAGRLIAAAAHHRDGVHAPLLGNPRQQVTAHFTAFHQARHVRGCQARGLQHGVRPIARAHIQPQRAGGIGKIAGAFAGHAQAQIILGQKHGLGAGEHVGFVAAQPEQLRRGEAGHGAIAGDRPHRNGCLQLGTFRLRAAVVPEDGRPQHALAGVEQHRAVHLPGQADGGDARGEIRKSRHHRAGGAPPVVGVLLAVFRLGAANGKRLARLAHEGAVFVDHHRLYCGGAEVDAEIHGLARLGSLGEKPPAPAGYCAGRAPLPCARSLAAARSCSMRWLATTNIPAVPPCTPASTV